MKLMIIAVVFTFLMGAITVYGLLKDKDKVYVSGFFAELAGLAAVAVFALMG